MGALHAAGRLIPPIGEPAVLGRRPWLRWAVFAVLAVAAVLIGDLTGLPGSAPVLAPVPAVAVLWLAGSPSRRRRVLDACTLVAITAFGMNSSNPAPVTALLLASATAAQGFASAWTYRWLRPAGLELRAARDLLVLAAGTGIGAAAALPVALIAFAVLPDPASSMSGPQWLLHTAVSAFILVAAVLQIGGRATGEHQDASVLERCGIVVAFALTYALAFWVLPAIAAAFLLLPVAVWSALRESLRAVTVHLVVAATAVVVAVRDGHHPWTALPSVLQVVMAEAFLGVLALVTLVIALFRADSQRNARRAREQAELLSAVFASINDAVTVVDARGELLLRNRAADELFGAVATPGMAAPETGYGFFRPDGSRTAHEDLPVVRALGGTPTTGAEGRLVSPAHPRGRLVRVSAHPLPASPDAPWSGGAVAALHDITDLRAATDEVARAHDLFASVLEAATEHAIVACDPQGLITLFNEGAERLLGRSEHEVLGRHVLELHHPADLPSVAAQLGFGGAAELFTADRAGGPVTFRARYVRPDGSAVPVSVTCAAMTGADGRVTGYTSLASDISTQLAAEEQLTHQALHDALTGLANRRLLHRRLEHELAAGQPLGLLYIDLDGFKAVNDTAGHAAGDELLVAVSHLLRACVREGDTVARLGGDEFAVLCPAITRAEAVTVGGRILEGLDAPGSLGGLGAVVGASIGVRWSDDRVPDRSGTSAEQLLHDADAAMYAAKRAGKGRIVVHAAGDEPREAAIASPVR